MKIKQVKLTRVGDISLGTIFSYQGEQFYKLDGQDPKYNVVRFSIHRLDLLIDRLEVHVHPDAELTL